MSASRVGKCRYSVPGPTPAFLAMEFSDAWPAAVSASRATSMMRARFCRASARTGSCHCSAMPTLHPLVRDRSPTGDPSASQVDHTGSPGLGRPDVTVHMGAQLGEARKGAGDDLVAVVGKVHAEVLLY